ncbi:FAD-dependent oxidoreductase [Rhodopseudomonas palustris]|uniref:FAD-dependent oxidoreductase n=1 Tax=Rhodopseudomonas palustris TaxID=1076 RepID=UPI0020CBD799|nr:FAD-dependent oxidoreductase [Rhodopseudomonas palustris]
MDSTCVNIPAWEIRNRISLDEASSLPCLAETDVLVVGGGASGVAAATVAAESNCSTILVERYGFCGGAAVAGLSGTICGLFLASEQSKPKQVVFGFSERFRSELARRGGVTEPQKYGKTFVVTHDPLKWRETADSLLTVSGVRILFHTVVVAVIMDGDRHLGVVIESNAGRSVVFAKRTIDASGDAAVVARAGHPWRFGDQGRIQNPTMFFRLGGVDVERFVAHWGEDTISPPDIVEALTTAGRRNYDLPRKKIWIFPTTQPGELLVNATRLSARDGSLLNVINPEDWTVAEIDGRRQVREYARFLAAHVEGCERNFVIDTGVECGVRQTRSIDGLATLTNEDVVEGTKRPDSICRSPWPIELHAGEKPKLHWLLDDYYDVPFGALVPAVGENIIVAGRCLSAEHEALASARVTAQCFEYGHAAGVAAALSISSDVPLHTLEPSSIAEKMKKSGSAL